MILRGSFKMHDKTGKEIVHISSVGLKEEYEAFGRKKFLELLESRIIHTSKDGKDFIKQVKNNEL